MEISFVFKKKLCYYFVVVVKRTNDRLSPMLLVIRLILICAFMVMYSCCFFSLIPPPMTLSHRWSYNKFVTIFMTVPSSRLHSLFLNHHLTQYLIIYSSLMRLIPIENRFLRLKITKAETIECMKEQDPELHL